MFLLLRFLLCANLILSVSEHSLRRAGVFFGLGNRRTFISRHYSNHHSTNRLLHLNLIDLNSKQFMLKFLIKAKYVIIFNLFSLTPQSREDTAKQKKTLYFRMLRQNACFAAGERLQGPSRRWSSHAGNARI